MAISKQADLARFFGASALFYYHLGISTGYPMSGWGEYGVAVFILLAGIAYVCFSSFHPSDLRSYRRYICARITAVFPMFITINLALYLGSFLYPSGLGRPFTFLEFILSSAGLSQYFGFRYLSTVMWFIPFIMQAYLLFPFIDYLLNRVSGAWVIAASFVISLALVAMVFSCCPSNAKEICVNWCVLFRLPEVSLGLILGKTLFSKRDPLGGLSALATYCVLSLLLATVVSSHFVREAYVLALPWRGLVVSLLVSILALVLAPVFTTAKKTGFLRLIGVASFPFFLIHRVAIVCLYNRVGTTWWVWFIYFISCWSAALILAMGSARVRNLSSFRALRQ